MRTRDKYGLWLMIAMFAPLAHFGDCGYVAMCCAVLAFLPLSLLVRGKQRKVGRTFSFLRWIWLLVVLSQLLPHASAYWMGGGKAVPLTLLALAAWGASGERAERTGNVIFWLTLPVLVLFSALAVQKIETVWLMPEAGEWSAGLIVGLLLPALPGKAHNLKGRMLAIIGITTVGLAMLIQGCLSLRVAQIEEAPLYTVGRTVGGGVEILVSVGITLSWYALCNTMIDSATALTENMGIAHKWGRWLSALVTSVLIVGDCQISGIILVLSCLLLWIILPLIRLKK